MYFNQIKCCLMDIFLYIGEFSAKNHSRVFVSSRAFIGNFQDTLVPFRMLQKRRREGGWVEYRRRGGEGGLMNRGK